MADVTRDSVVHEAISYLYSNGRTAHAPVTAEVKFTQHGSQDQVTKQITWQPVASQQLTSVKSPVIAGYVPDVTEVPAIAVNFGGSDIFKSVIYTSTQQQAIIIYVDQTTGQNLKSVEQHGDADTTIPYRSKSDLQGYLDNGYLLVKNGYDPADKAPSFDNDQNIDQTFYVTLKHDIQTINPEHPGKPGQPINKNPGGPKYGPHTDAKSLTINGTQMIHYVDQDGNSVAPDDNSQHVQFTHEIVIDKVTGEQIADHGWTTAQTYKQVKSPTVKGYTTDQTMAGGKTVTHQQPDSVVYVHYMPVAQQRAKIVFVDQVTGDDLKTVTQSGQSDTVIPYLSEDDQATFANEHYVLVKNGYDPAGNAPNFDSNDAVDQIYYITLKHGTQPTTRQSDVTETIHYVYSNGKPAHDDVVVTKHFTQNGTKDLVTGQTEWQPVDSQQFTSVMSPEIVGYQADKKFIPAITVNFGDGNVTRTVTYSKVVQPTKPTSPTQPTAQPTKPTSPTQPTAQPTKPTSPTQPTNQPTKPTSPTQPTAQPTKPSGQQPTGSSVPTPRPVPAGRPTIPTAAPEPVPVVQPVAKVVTAQPVSLHQGQPTPRAAQRNNTTLPQTGNAEVVSAAALGLMGLALAGGFAATKKRHE